MSPLFAFTLGAVVGIAIAGIVAILRWPIPAAIVEEIARVQDDGLGEPTGRIVADERRLP